MVIMYRVMQKYQSREYLGYEHGESSSLFCRYTFDRAVPLLERGAVVSAVYHFLYPSDRFLGLRESVSRSSAGYLNRYILVSPSTRYAHTPKAYV
jgi:hypothetical protein